jgi:hypothetical protein
MAWAGQGQRNGGGAPGPSPGPESHQASGLGNWVVGGISAVRMQRRGHGLITPHFCSGGRWRQAHSAAAMLPGHRALRPCYLAGVLCTQQETVHEGLYVTSHAKPPCRSQGLAWERQGDASFESGGRSKGIRMDTQDVGVTLAGWCLYICVWV